MATEWALKKFDELSVHELYAILQLRIEVFIVEQQCPFQDADNKDQLTYHLMGWQEKNSSPIPDCYHRALLMSCRQSAVLLRPLQRGKTALENC